MSRLSSSTHPNLADFHDGLEPSVLVSQILKHLDERLAGYRLISSKNEYLQAAQAFPDTAMEYFFVLAKSDTKDHHWLWLLVLSNLTEVSNALLSMQEQLSTSLDTHVSRAAAILGPLFLRVAKHCETFFDDIDTGFLFGKGGLNVAHTKFLALISATLKLCSSEQSHLTQAQLVLSASKVTLRYFQQTCVVFKDTESDLYEHKVAVFPVLVGLAKCAFFAGTPLAILQLVFQLDNTQLVAVSESFLPSIILDLKVTLPLITDYYRYYGFCLVMCAVEGNQIHEHAADKADVFLKVLLAFPHLQLSNYMPEALAANEAVPARHPRLFSATEREEISFFYLLNTLLRMRALSEFVDPEITFIRERQFFTASFNKRCGAELDHLASGSLSRASSVVSMPRLAETRTPLQRILAAHVTISSILSEGTYKEKVRLVADFFKFTAENSGQGSIRRLVETFDMSSLHSRTNHFHLNSQAVLRIFHRIDPQQYPGKIAYIKFIDMVVRLLQLLSLKFASGIFGPSFNAAEFLSGHFNTDYLLREVLAVKDLLWVDEQNIVSVRFRFFASEMELLSNQFRLLEATRLLKADLQKVI